MHLSFEGLTPRTFKVVFFVVTLIHLIFLSAVPLSGDEAYHWEWARHLDLAYYDHPPMTAWIISFFTTIFGTSLTTVRLGALFSISVAAFLVYRLGGGLFKDDRVGVLAGILVLLAPIYVAGSIVMTTDPPTGLFSMLYIYCFYEATFNGKKGYWYAAGASLGAAMLCKFLAYMLVPPSLLFLLLAKDYRHWLLKKEPYLAALMGLLIFSPVIYWNINHDWATFVFNFSNRHEGATFGFSHVHEYLISQLLPVSPVIAVVGVFTLLWAGIKGIKGDARLLFLFLFSGLVLGFFGAISFFERVSLHWTAVAFFTFLITISAYLYKGGGLESKLFRRTLGAGIILLLLFDIFLHALALSPSMIKGEYEYSKWKGRLTTKKLKDFYGWDELGHTVEYMYGKLKEEDRGTPVFIATNTYTMSGLVAFNTPGRPYVSWMGLGYRGVNGLNYRYWDDFPAMKGYNALFVSTGIPKEREELLYKVFERVERIDLPIEEGGVLMRTFSLYRCYNFTGENP